jgi:endonuclease/exonuclease/phosphatase family metal-dependent hydrolase
MALLVRSWNVYHGMTSPRDRRSHLAEAVRLVTADEPDVVCLQEVPLWGCPKLAQWSGMNAYTRSARPVRFPPRPGGWITRLNQGALRSAVSGQANAILLAPGLTALEHRSQVISAGRGERRICHAVRLEGMVIANLHASCKDDRPDSGAAEILRSLAFGELRSKPGDALILAGDFNLLPGELPALPGFSPPGPRIDHILVRGAVATALEVWPEERRRMSSGLLSDHAPVELWVGQ